MMENNLLILGTVDNIKKFLPPQFSTLNGREVESTIFGFSNNITMCSFVATKNKTVLVLSTIHYTFEVEGVRLY